MAEGYINKYRPQTWDEVVGHEAAVRSLQKAVKDGTASSFLFTGGSGMGKTTLARLVARELGCLPQDILEIDAASNTGIDDMRQVMSTLDYRPLGGGKGKAIIVDEVHGLSKQAMNAILKVLEEPSEGVYFFLCTTEGDRIIKTFNTRCLHIDLKPVKKAVLLELLEFVAVEEKLKPPKGVLELCAEEAGGSPRQALSYLAACAAAKDIDDAYDLMGTAIDETEAVDLAKCLLFKRKWMETAEILKGLKGKDPESIRRTVQAYTNSVILGAKSVDDAGRYMEVLDAFSTPFHTPGDLTLACGKALL